MAGAFPVDPDDGDLHTTTGGTIYEYHVDHDIWVIYKDATVYLEVADIDNVAVNGELEAPISSNWAFDHDADAAAHHAAAIGGIVWRDTDPVGADWDKNTLVDNINWNDLDLSAILPAGATTAIIRLIVNDNLVGSIVQMRKNGHANSMTCPSIWTQVANKYVDQFFVVGVDGDRKCEIVVTPKPTDWVAIFVIICGWGYEPT